VLWWSLDMLAAMSQSALPATLVWLDKPGLIELSRDSERTAPTARPRCYRRTRLRTAC
jgi:hypothetical protein